MKGRLDRLLTRVIPSGSVLQRTVKSGGWVTVTKISLRLSQVLMLVVLARLLSPRDFGIMGIALLTLSATERLTEIGLDAALIQQKKDNVDEYLNTTWCLEIGRGILAFSALFVLAPFIAAGFGEPQAETLIRVLGVVPILFGLRNPGVVYFEKDLEFHKDFIYQSSGGLAQLVVGVGYALYSPTVWALVFASISRPAAQTATSYYLHDYRPWPSFEYDAARELIAFGKWITGASILRFLYSQGDDAFIGWYLSATALGFYQYAYRLADMPPTEMAGVVAKLMFPAYSKLQGDQAKLQQAVLRSTRFTAFLAFPIGFGIALVTPSFVPAILGSEWLAIVLTMQILAVYGLLHALTRIYGSLWKSVGRPDYDVKTGLIRIGAIAVLIWPATARWGIEGTALVITGVYLVLMVPIRIHITAKLTEMPSWKIYREYLYPCIAAGTMFGTLWFARTLIEVPPLVEFLALVPAGAVIYFTVSLLLDKQFNWGIGQVGQMITKAIR